MGSDSKISWCHDTANVWIGCVKVSPGCENCYAENATFVRRHVAKLWGPAKTTARYVTKGWEHNLRSFSRRANTEGTSRRVFLNSLSDFFEDHPVANDVRPKAWNVIRELQNLDFLILTKRPINFERFLPSDWGDGYPNVWLGVSVESKEYLPRVLYLRGTPAHIRWVSYEPALGPIEPKYFRGIDWVVYGGESQDGRRPDNIAWARALNDAADRIGFKFYYKQQSAARAGSLPNDPIATAREFPRQCRRYVEEAPEGE